MKKRMKKVVSLLLGTVMAVSLLAGCGGSEDGASANSGADVSSDTSAESGSDASGSETAGTDSGETGAVDTSEHVDLRMYLIGDRTPDLVGV